MNQVSLFLLHNMEAHVRKLSEKEEVKRESVPK